ncbi:hypothetical protein KC340_g11644 [Hortaea werneckii]|nr:hypothetical protein KC340_g11644 [Hortaea werneckii]KAI7392536.1 hypothetical protein KC328_g6990 [Hortaea werneckii]
MDPDTALRDLPSTEALTIIDIAQPFLNPSQPDNSQDGKRNSNASDISSSNNTSPSLLAADLAHYRDLFTKLRFSYVEQVTKERFLKTITDKEPEFVESSENAELEERLRGDKAALKERKQEVANLLKELEEQSRSLAQRNENVRLKTTQLETLPSEIANLESIITDLQSAAQPKSSNPSLNLPLQPTVELLEKREQESADLDAKIEALRAALPGKRQQVERLRDELTPMQARKIKTVQEAQEGRRRREGGGAGGAGDELEEKGRWLRGSEASLKGMLETSALAGSSSSASSSMASSTSAAPFATSTGSSDDDGLSGGQIAGIVVGCVVGGLLLIGIGLFCCCRSFLKKRKAKKHQAQLDEQSIMEKTKEPIHSDTNPNYSGTGTQQGRPEQYLQRQPEQPTASQQHEVQQPMQQQQQLQPTTPQLERGNPVNDNPHGLSGPYKQGGEQFYDAPHTANRVFGAPGQTMSELSQPQVRSHASSAAAERQLGTTGYLPTTSTGEMSGGVSNQMTSNGRAADPGEAGRTMYRDGQGLASVPGNMGKRVEESNSVS